MVKRRKFIKIISEVLHDRFGLKKLHIKIEEASNLDFNAQNMAERLAYSLDRGRNYIRAGNYILRKIMDSGRALGAEIRISGVQSSNQNAATHVFRAGTMNRDNQPSKKGIDKGVAHSIQKSGVLGVIVKIQHRKLAKSKVKYTIEKELTDLTEEDENLINVLK